MNKPIGATDRTSVRRFPEKAVKDRDQVNAILDAGLVAHVSCVVDGQPFVMPVGYARDGDRVEDAADVGEDVALGQQRGLHADTDFVGREITGDNRE